MISSLKDAIVAQADHELGMHGMRAIIENGTITRTWHKLGGSHTVVTFPPLNALVPLQWDQLASAIQPEQAINLYQHISFCEFMCPFCSYTTTYSPVSGEEKVTAYVQALLQENMRWMQLLGDSSIASLYVGGGTPTVLSLRHLHLLFDKYATYRRTAEFTACCETSPLSIIEKDGTEKLSMLTGWGINRFSIGIQSFNTRILKKSRNYDQACAIGAITRLMNTGQEINIDLIQDLPGQGLTELFEDLEQIEQLRPHQVTWYILRLENGAAWHKQYHCDERDTNKEYQSIRHRYILRLAMQQLGYLERPGGRFIRSLQYEDRYKSIRSGCDATLLGMGASAYSHGWNYFFRNTHDPNRKKAITQYIDTVAKNELPVCEGMYLDEEIKYASRLIKGIRSSVDIDPSQRSAVNYLPEISIILQELEGQGLVVKTTSGSFCLSDMGRLLEEEVCSLLYTAAVKYRLLARGKYWHQPNKTLQKTVL